MFSLSFVVGEPLYSGRVLVLAQDFSTADRIRRRAQDDPGNPFRHRPDNTTNLKLVELLRQVGDLARANKLARAQTSTLVDAAGTNASRCGLVYGSIIWFLKHATSVSGAPPNLRRALTESAPVIRCAIESMPALDRIICLGRLAYEGLARMHGRDNRWRADLVAHEHFTISSSRRPIRCFPTSHLGPRGLAMRAGFPNLGRKTAHQACIADFERALEPRP